MSDKITQIENAIEKLRQLVTVDVKYNWYDFAKINKNGRQGDKGDRETRENLKQLQDLNGINYKEYQPALVNEKGYIVFPSGREVKWLIQKITIPENLQGYCVSGLSLRLVLTWWAEDAKIYINGELVQQGDLFDSSARILITDSAITGNEYIVAIRLVSPGHDIGALMKSYLIYEKINKINPGLVADELTVLLKYTSQFEPSNLEIIAKEINQLNWHNITNGDKFESDLATLRSKLLPLAQNIKQRCFNLLGHAHLDMAWLWTTAETYEVAECTFESVISLQQNFPHLTFGHTSPALYQWIEQHRPELFKSIQNAVRLGKWEILGGMWIEPEVNLINGESLIRQLLYGQEYFKAKFGEITTVAWLPDSFGFTWQLPQILKQCGIEYFVTGKLHWNDTTKFPYGCFWWESPDGTQLLTVMSPPNVTGVMDTNPITMTDYGVDWETQTGLQEIFWLPGVGDHGGGPTRDMLEVADKWRNSPFFPDVKFTTATEYLNKISRSGNNIPFPVWKDELYLELHRGCYTTHGDQKRFNRYCEGLLYEAELFATLANLICEDGFVGQPLSPTMNNTIDKKNCQQQIEVAWKKVLFNQFHDILPGTSIKEVFTEANEEWEAAINIGENILEGALNEIASQIKIPSPPHPQAKPLIVFNSLNWMRSQVISISVSDSQNYDFVIYNLDGKEVRSQLIEDNKLIFWAEDIPSVGYRLFWLYQKEITKKKEQALVITEAKKYRLENERLKVIINSHTGDIDSIYDKENHQEILRQPGNKLQAFEDKGQYWDAWNIDPEYEKYPLPDAELKSITWINNGEVEQRIRVIKKLNKSEFIQDYILEKYSPVLKISNTVDWQETHVVVKTVFPLNLASDRVTYEIPCGAIERSTKPQTPAERAKWEVSALKWIDLTDNQQNYGVSILNDCKYGYDSKSNELRVTLLRSSVWPNPDADRGKHHFNYAIYPHLQDWRSAKTVHKSYEFNLTLKTVFLDEFTVKNDNLPPISSLINLSAENLILMALKPGDNQNLILRAYECHGATACLEVKSDFNLTINGITNCLEQETATNKINLNRQPSYLINPWKIITVKTIND